MMMVMMIDFPFIGLALYIPQTANAEEGTAIAVFVSLFNGRVDKAKCNNRMISNMKILRCFVAIVLSMYRFILFKSR